MGRVVKGSKQRCDFTNATFYPPSTSMQGYPEALLGLLKLYTKILADT